jgi:hypothetical protein
MRKLLQYITGAGWIIHPNNPAKPVTAAAHDARPRTFGQNPAYIRLDEGRKVCPKR